MPCEISTTEYLESLAKEVAGKFGRLNSIIKNHNLSRGDYHEEVLRAFFRNFLSRRFSVKKGFIYAGPDKVSKQTDIIIVDENTASAYVFQQGDFAVVTPDAVAAVIEVKSNCSQSEFVESFKNIESAKRLIEFPTNIPGVVFSFRGGPKTSTLEKWFKDDRLLGIWSELQYGPDAIMFFDASPSSNGLLIKCRVADNNIVIKGDGDSFFSIIALDKSVKKLECQAARLSLILQLIMDACDRRISRERMLLNNKKYSYAQLNKLKFKKDYLASDGLKSLTVS